MNSKKDSRHLDEAIARKKQAVELPGCSSSDQMASLMTLTSLLTERYERIGNTKDLYEAARLARHAAALMGQGSRDPLTEPRDLGKRLAEQKHKCQIADCLMRMARYFARLQQEKQEPKFLHTAIETARGAVAAMGELTCTMELIDLLATQFQIAKEKKYTNEAIGRARDAIKSRVDLGGDQSVSFMKMMEHLHEKYEETSETEYLDEATDMARKAVEIARTKVEWTTYCSQEQSFCPTKLISLLAEQDQITKDRKYIREAIDSARDFVSLMESNRRGLSEFLRNMIKCFQEQYEKTGETVFQDEAVSMESKSTNRVNQHKQTQCDTTMKLPRLPVQHYGKAQDIKHPDGATQVAIKNKVVLSLERLRGCEPERSLHDPTTSSTLFEMSTQRNESYSLPEDSASFSGDSLAVHTECDLRKRQCHPGRVLHLQGEAINREEWIRASINLEHRNADSEEQLRQFIKSFTI
ncbi:uncharacterized protein FFNC_15562 [Fusarium fujikuroi]|nr:uncharacterized protein FFNC_15562 [Fusarium fujikuroi]